MSTVWFCCYSDETIYYRGFTLFANVLVIERCRLKFKCSVKFMRYYSKKLFLICNISTMNQYKKHCAKDFKTQQICNL